MQEGTRDLLTGEHIARDAVLRPVRTEHVPYVLALSHAPTTGVAAGTRRDGGTQELSPALLNYVH